MRMPPFDSSSLFIFCDASVTNFQEQEFISCSGAMAYIPFGHSDKLIDEKFVTNRCSTNNNGEINAIYQGLLVATKYQHEFENIILLSDSKISIYGLREWIENWTKKANLLGSEDLIGSTNSPVKNQQEILACINQIIYNNLNVKLYHQKGHAVGSTTKALEVFKSTNNVTDYVPMRFIDFITEKNDEVDNKTRLLLNQFVSTITDGPRSTPIELVTRKYTPFDINQYLGLVRN